MAEITLFAWIIVIAANDINAVFEFSNLDKTQIKSQKDTGADEQDEKRHAPYDPTEELNEVLELFEENRQELGHARDFGLGGLRCANQIEHTNNGSNDEQNARNNHDHNTAERW